MRVEIIRNNDNKVVGYKIVRESIDDRETIERIRDMYFWGHLGKIKYDGRSSEFDSDETTEIRFVSEEHQKQQDEERKVRLERRHLIFKYLRNIEDIAWTTEELVKLNDDQLNTLADYYNYFTPKTN
jgi:hypothetical protein